MLSNTLVKYVKMKRNIFQYSSQYITPGFRYTGDSAWYIESSAQWYKAQNKPDLERTYVEAACVIANPQVALWHRPSINGAPGDEDNWSTGVRQYGLHTLLMFLTEFKGLDKRFLVDGFYSKTDQLPQEYLFRNIGPSIFRSYFADWAAHNTGGLDYITQEQKEAAYREFDFYGDWDLFRPSVWYSVDSGTNGEWIRPDQKLTARGWAYNVYNITNTLTTTYTFELKGDSKGSEGAPGARRAIACKD